MSSPFPAATGTSDAQATALVSAREGAVSCDLSALAVLAIAGADASTFLQGQLSNDVRALTELKAQYTSFNSPKGRMLANFVLWRDGDAYRALLPAELAAPIQKRLAMFVLRSKVKLADISVETLRIGVGGPRAEEALRANWGTAPSPMALAKIDGVTLLGLTGSRFVVLSSASAAAPRIAGVTEAPFAAWQWLTIRAGVPVVTAPVQDQLIPQAANFDLLDGISFTKGCYTGQEIVARMQYLGRLKERLFALHVDAPVVAAGTRIFAPAFGDQPCGIVVNAAPAPGGGNDMLAVVQLAAVDGGGLRLSAPDGLPLAVNPLPYPVPPPQAPRARVGKPS